MSRTWKSREACVSYYRAEGFLVGFSTCTHCGHTDESAVHPLANLSNLQCSKCLRFGSSWSPDPPSSPTGKNGPTSLPH